ncbi:MAG: M48 family metallopeptidase [Bacteroidota bacterium]|jgi:heat shock protein HtpX
MIPRTGNIYEQQQTNDLLTALFAGIFILYYLILGYGTDVFVLKNDPLGIVYPASDEIPYATLIAFILAGAYTAYSFYRGDDLVLKSVKKIDRIWWDDESNRLLIDVIKEMSIASGVPMPSVYLVHDDDPNAFSTGRDPEHASIGVTTGLLQKLDREELQAVMAHEMAHIRNHDIRLMTLMATLMGGSVLLTAYTEARWLESMSFLRRVTLIGGATVFFIVWVGMVVFTPLITFMLELLISHEREYQADATAAELTRNPEAVVKALEKLDSMGGPTWSINSAMGHLCVISPMGKYMNMAEQTIRDRILHYYTHPPMEKRIQAIKAMAFAHQAQGESQ